MAKIVFKNEASGHARVGGQVGQGVINVGPDLFGEKRAVLKDQIADLQQALLATRERGEIDPARFAAAESQLEEVDTHLDGSDENARQKLLEALGRLKRLIPGAIDLGAKVAAIIGVVRGLQ
jgi:hypothetical protein